MLEASGKYDGRTRIDSLPSPVLNNVLPIPFADISYLVIGLVELTSLLLDRLLYTLQNVGGSVDCISPIKMLLPSPRPVLYARPPQDVI